MMQVISSLQHPLVKHFVKLRTEKNYRYENQSIVLEGTKPIQEIAAHVQKLLYTPAYASFASSFSCEKWQVTDEMIRKISGMISPEGVVAEGRMPSFTSLDQSHWVLGLDGISDPGNMGALLRTALALGWDTVCFLPGSCDPFNDKTLRAARGAHFKLALVNGTAEQLYQWAQSHHVQSIVADIKGEAPEKMVDATHRLLVLGNEAHGASPLIRQFCHPVTIPMPGEMESLNVAVAGGILLYLLAKQRSL